MEPGCAHPAQNRPEEIEKPRQYYLPWLKILCVIQDAGPKKAAAMKLFRKKWTKTVRTFRKSKTGGKRRLASLTA